MSSKTGRKVTSSDPAADITEYPSGKKPRIGPTPLPLDSLANVEQPEKVVELVLPVPKAANDVQLVSSTLPELTEVVELINRLVSSHASKCYVSRMLGRAKRQDATLNRTEVKVMSIDRKDDAASVERLGRDLTPNAWGSPFTIQRRQSIHSDDPDSGEGVNDADPNCPYAVTIEADRKILILPKMVENIRKARTANDTSVLRCEQFHTAIVITSEVNRYWFAKLFPVRQDSHQRPSPGMTTAQTSPIGDDTSRTEHAWPYEREAVWEFLMLGGFLFGEIHGGGRQKNRKDLIYNLVLARWSDGSNVSINYQDFITVFEGKNDWQSHLPFCKQAPEEPRLSFRGTPKLFDMNRQRLALSRKQQELLARKLAVVKPLPSKIVRMGSGGVKSKS